MSNKPSKAERLAELKRVAKERREKFADRIAKFRASYAALGIPIDDDTILRMCARQPIDLSYRMERDPGEEI